MFKNRHCTIGFATAFGARVLAAFLIPGTATAAEAIGMNQPNTAWLSPAEWQSDLAAMREAGISSLRLTLTPPFPASIDRIDQAVHAGFHILLNISLDQPTFYSNEIARRRRSGTVPAAYPLSKVSSAKFLATWNWLMATLQQRSIHLDGIEVGNEINWAAFNGDFPVGPEALYETGDAMPSVSSPVEKGFERFIGLLRAVGASARSHRVTLIAPGLASVARTWSQQQQAGALDASAAANLLLKLGLAKTVDGLSVHVYPSSPYAGHPACGIELSRLQQTLHACDRNARSGLSCWITEIGATSPSKACGTSDPRAAQLGCLSSLVGALAQTHRLDRVYLFAWQQNTGFSFFRDERICPDLLQFTGDSATVPSSAQSSPRPR